MFYYVFATRTKSRIMKYKERLEVIGKITMFFKMPLKRYI